MSAFKKLNRQDVFITSYSAKKEWNFSGSDLTTNGVSGINAVSGSLQIFSGSTNYSSNLYHQSIKHLYYKDFQSNYTLSGSLEHYLQSSIVSGSRALGDDAFILSIPRKLVGTHIEPGTFSLFYQSSTFVYVESGYVESGYVE